MSEIVIEFNPASYASSKVEISDFSAISDRWISRADFPRDIYIGSLADVNVSSNDGLTSMIPVDASYLHRLDYFKQRWFKDLFENEYIKAKKHFEVSRAKLSLPYWELSSRLLNLEYSDVAIEFVSNSCIKFYLKFTGGKIAIVTCKFPDSYLGNKPLDVIYSLFQSKQLVGSGFSSTDGLEDLLIAFSNL